MERYLGYSINYRKKFTNPFRKDKNPDCMFVKGYSRLFFTDYARPEYSGDCFKMCALYYGLSIPGDFYEVCRHINQDFNLGLGDGNNSSLKALDRKEVIPYVGSPHQESYSDIKVRVRNFSDYDLAYFAKYNITKERLEEYNIYRGESVWINGTLFYHYQETDLCFVYVFNDGFKIYKPFGYNDKWRCNSLQIQGYEQLPEKGDLLFITKSMKDILVLRNLGFYAVAPQAEGYPIPENVMNELKQGFKRIIVFYDNDEAGVKNSIKITETYNIGYFNIPKYFNTKDPSDFVEMYNEEELLHLIKQKIDG